MRLRNWLRKISGELLPDVGENVTHTIRVGAVILVEVVLYLCLQLPGVPRELAKSIGEILIGAIEITVVVFCLGSLAVYTINACAVVRNRIKQTNIGKAAFAALAALACLVIYRGLPDAVHFDLREVLRPTSVVFSLDRTVMRGGAPSTMFALPARAQLIDLSFFVPACANCRYVAILDEGSPTEVFSRDKYGNFTLSCVAARLTGGPHFLRIIEVKPLVGNELDEPHRSFVFAFEVVRQ